MAGGGPVSRALLDHSVTSDSLTVVLGRFLASLLQ